MLTAVRRTRQKSRMKDAIAIMLLLACMELSDSLLLSAFNIRSFGDKKASNSTLMDIISEVVHRYDIILIQEVRDSDLTATQKLMQHVNKAPSPHVYDYIVSEQLGSNSYKERYLFLYRTESVSVIKSFTYDDGCESCGTDTFSREPFVVMFSSRLSAVKNFALVPQHTSPELAVKEVNALYDVAAYTRDLWKTNDIILLGDFNAGCDYILDSEWQQIRLFTDKSYHWLITDDADTTVTHTKCPYDRIVATADMMSGIAPNSAKVFEFESALGLSQEMALAVSDHFPVEVKLL